MQSEGLPLWYIDHCIKNMTFLKPSVAPIGVTLSLFVLEREWELKYYWLHPLPTAQRPWILALPIQDSQVDKSRMLLQYFRYSQSACGVVKLLIPRVY